MTSGPPTRRNVLRFALGSAASLIGLSATPPARAEDDAHLVVFIPTDMRTRAFQDILAGAIPRTQVTAFSRYTDFEKALEARPDAVLALQATLRAKGIPVTTLGSRDGKRTEKFALVAADRAPDPSSVASVAAVDVLGREGMKDFVSELLGATPKVERVAKVEDLLPTLQIALADAILLPERLVSAIQSQSKLNLKATQLSRDVGLAGLAVRTAAGGPLIERLRALSPRINQEIGVTQWD